uniref:Rho GTPase-activating protein 100F n=1 Tax=Aceria tosichella TaxID=561515 RepID=A0A6G1SLX9_9ACAR
MEPIDPFSQLALCCFGRRQRSDGFKTQALRNQFYYSPSMAHIGPGNTTTWPMGAVGPFGPSPVGFIAAANHPPPLTQPYILYTQPLIIAGNQNAQSQVPQGGATMTLVQHSKSPNGQMQTISFVGTQPPKLQSLIGPSQYAIYSNSIGATPVGGPSTQTYAPVARDQTIYESPRHSSNRLVRNRSNYLGPIVESSYQPLQQQQQGPEKGFNQQHRPRSLNSDVYRRLELIEKQVDLTRDMDLVERHGIVITRAIEAHSLAPYITDEILLRYQEQFLFSDDYVIRFIEIIKRPGQTLGLYIRLVHFENQLTKVSREGIVITKIESNSPVYTSQVLHVGDEILSINLIDIQNMSLDDVVTLMSIPKRLVLALRIPRARDSQMHTNLAFNQNQLALNNSVVRLDDDGFQYAQRASHVQGQQLYQEDVSPTNAGANRPAYSSENFGPGMMRPTGYLGQSASQSNFMWDPTGSRQNCDTFNTQSSSSNQLVRPLRVKSALHMNDTIAEYEKGEESPTMVDENLSRPSQHSGNNFMPTRQVVRNGPSDETTNNGQHHATPTSSTMNQIERQMATTLSLDEHRDESDRFRNFSVDPEIATLEREAMNKEKHTIHMDVMNDHHHQLSYNESIAESMDNTMFARQQAHNQATNTVPRRTLPNKPDLCSTSSPSADVNSSSLARRPVLNNIRLGETPEQSSYFSSSIDAINRELKELRQQRMAVSNNDPVH